MDVPWMFKARSFITITVVRFVSFSLFFITFSWKLGEYAAVEQLHRENHYLSLPFPNSSTRQINYIK